MNKRLIDVKELSEYIGVKINTIYSWVNMRQVPYVKMGGLLKFDLKDIDTWIDKKKVKVFKYKEIV